MFFLFYVSIDLNNFKNCIYTSLNIVIPKEYSKTIIGNLNQRI